MAHEKDELKQVVDDLPKITESLEIPSTTSTNKGQVKVLITLLTLALTEGAKIGAEILIKKFSRR